MKRPNILLINCDDLGYGDLGCYGSKLNDTPHIDRLASEGLRLTDFYMASPVCSASRAAMMTGCYSQRVGFGDCQVLFPGQPFGLNPNENSVAKVLKGAGYRTKIIGKWHCGDQPDFLPTRHGFDEYFGLPYSNDMGRQVERMDSPPLPLMRNEEVIQEQPDQRGITERYVDEALQFIRRDSEAPFFLYLAHMYVHVPLFVPKHFLESSRNGAYGGAVTAIDWAMGVLDAELQRLGIKDDTMVVFTSDNGSRSQGEGGSNAPLRGHKGHTWEGGQRLPCILRWPGRIKAGSVNDGMASSMDFLATFADLSGAELPCNKIDSLSMVKTWTEGAESPRKVFAYYYRKNLDAVRKGDWKLHFSKSGWSQHEDEEISELYNLREDLGECHNLYDQHPEIVAELEAEAESFRSTLGDARLDREGSEVRPCGQVRNPKPLTQYRVDHPYMIAYYDLADMGTMCG